MKKKIDVSNILTGTEFYIFLSFFLGLFIYLFFGGGGGGGGELCHQRE